jgi:hypothetical protein
MYSRLDASFPADFSDAVGIILSFVHIEDDYTLRRNLADPAARRQLPRQQAK